MYEDLFNAGFVALSVASVVFGLMIDALGPRATATTALILSVVGNIGIAYSTPQREYLVFPSFLLM